MNQLASIAINNHLNQRIATTRGTTRTNLQIFCHFLGVLGGGRFATAYVSLPFDDSDGSSQPHHTHTNPNRRPPKKLNRRTILSLKEYTLHSFIRNTANTTSEQLSNMKKFVAYTLPSTHPHHIPCIGIEPTTTDKSQRPMAQKFESNISTNISTDYLTAATKRQIFWNNRFII